jgi:hypothetical protein
LEYRAFWFPYDHRVSRFDEAFTIICCLLRDGRADFDGAYYRAQDCVLDPGPARPGGPPLLLGSVSPRMLRIGLPMSTRGVSGGATTATRPADSPPSATASTRRPCRPGACRVRSPPPRRCWSACPAAPGGLPAISGHLAAMASADATLLQLVVDPITGGSIEMLGDVLATLDCD